MTLMSIKKESQSETLGVMGVIRIFKYGFLKNSVAVSLNELILKSGCCILFEIYSDALW